jgi:hypothetical protein
MVANIGFMYSECMLIWNVCDLNGHARRDVVAEYVLQEKISLFCL